MKTFKYLSFLLIVVIACSTAKPKAKKSAAIEETTHEKTQSESRERIAVLDFKTVGLPVDRSKVISELIRTDLINTNKYAVMERSQVDMIFKEHGFTSLGVTDDTSAAKIGKLLAAQKILIGNVMKLGESIVITARVVDVEKGVAESSAKVTAENDETMVGEITGLVAALTGSEDLSENEAVVSKTPKSAKVILKADKRSYAVGEDIAISFKNFPGTKYDYISLARENDPPRNHYTYQYTSRQTEGAVTFYGGIGYAGKYEARAHTNYDKGDIKPTAVLKFTVK